MEPRARLEGALVAAGVLALYLVSAAARSDAVILGNDVVPYALGLVAGDPGAILYPHHPLTHLLAWLLYGAASPFTGGGVLAALDAQRWVSAAGGALAALALWNSGRLLAGPMGGRLLALGFALSTGNWLYGSVGETYLPATAALAWLWHLSLSAALTGKVPSAAHLAGWMLLATLLRQDAVLALPWLCLLLPWCTFLGALVGAGAASLALYALAWGIAGGESGFVPWLRGLADTGLWGATPGGSAVAMSLGLTAAAFAWGLWPAAGALWSALLAFGGLAAALLWPKRLEGRAAPSPLAPGQTLGRVALALALFAAARVAFFSWWQPSNIEYHTGTLLPLWLLFAVALAARARGAGAREPSAREPGARGTGTPPPAPGARRVGLALAGVLAAAVGNAQSLILPARSAGIDEQAREAFAWAGEGGAVVTFDALAGYSLLRVPGPPTPVVDLGPGGLDAEAFAAFVIEWLPRLDSGAALVIYQDHVLWDLLGLPAPPLDPERTAALIGLGATDTREDKRGRAYLARIAR